MTVFDIIEHGTIKMNTFPEFKGFSKIPRYSRECIITEKIDGTCGCIYIDFDMNIYAGSKNRWLWGSIQDEIHNDNHGFAQWVKTNQDELRKLGIGYHFGEWWGKGIQRGYGITNKRFSLFNIKKWTDNVYKPDCCEIVPILFEGMFTSENIENTLKDLQTFGSVASFAYDNPEGIVIFHKHSGHFYKKTILHDEKPKSIKDE